MKPSTPKPIVTRPQSTTPLREIEETTPRPSWPEKPEIPPTPIDEIDEDSNEIKCGDQDYMPSKDCSLVSENQFKLLRDN